jgi:DNA-binding NtrC family response regulator
MTKASELPRSQTSDTASIDLFRSGAVRRPYLILIGSADNGGAAPDERLYAVEDGLELGRHRPSSRRSVRLLALADRCVSSKHARIARGAKGFEVVDLDSRNGTFVDGVAVKRQALHDGSLLFFGGHAVVFRLLTDDLVAAIDEESRAPLGPVPTASPAMASALQKLRRLAPTSEPIFLTGETGTGKEVYARAIHRTSGRRGKFVALNCSAIPIELVESELFGYARGAHSQATQGKRGLIEQAESGTLFLDELGDMPRAAQAKLLRFLQDREVLALGSTDSRRVDTRVIAATAQVDDHGSPVVRKDLLMRLGAQPVLLPPLRDRPEDIGMLAHYLGGPHARRFDNPAFLALCLHDWPGNVRELEKVVREAVLLGGTGLIGLEHLPAPLTGRFLRPADATQPRRRSPRTAPSEVELERLLEEHEGRVADVARLLDRNWSVVWRWMKRYQLDPDRFRKHP